MNFIKLTKSPLSVDEITQLVSDASCGAVSLFVGTTRDNFEGKTVHRLEYEAYDSMAEKEINKICQECRTKWNVKKIAVHHRLGVVNVKEASIVIAVSSEHRRESLEAVSYLIDTLKSSVPIWKKEIYSDNESEWKQNKECAWKKMEKLTDVEIKEEPIDDYTDHEITEFKVFPYSNSQKRKCDNEYHSCKKKRQSDSTFVRITAARGEIDRRIKAFEERKREELNILNIQEFCLNGLGENGCARTAAVLLRSLDSTSHLKVTKINNTCGPQTSIVNAGSSVKPWTPSNLQSEGFEERLGNLEKHLHMKSENVSSLSVYSRITALEKKVLFLEGLSPEYFNLQNQRFLKPYDEDLEDDDDKNGLNKDSQSSCSDDDNDDFGDFEDQDDITMEQLDQMIAVMGKQLSKKYPNFSY